MERVPLSLMPVSADGSAPGISCASAGAVMTSIVSENGSWVVAEHAGF
jgi:hypothetical protein